MKKKAIIEILSGVLCLTMLMSATVFAETGLKKISSETENNIISEEVKQQAEQYITEEGIITQAEDKGEYCRVQIDNDNMGMIFYIDEDAFIIDQQSGKRLTAKDLKSNMRITAILPAKAPMTLSLPPQTSQAVGFIIRSDNGSMDLSLYNDSLVNKNNTLKLNLSENTKIVDAKGSDKVFTAEDIKNNECAVLYTVSTRSIPAQTAPEMVIILDKENQLQPSEPEYVSLRNEAEAKGYKVEWTSNKKPIVLTKNDMKIEITVGSDGFEFTHRTKDMKALDQLEKMDLPMVLKNGQAMVSSNFIDALE
ncbi:MAG: copper amine oxidase N-terminal domain-containing protein [Clostridiales bacterium]|jgi:hypothetical protein|nr:copper amine oxidase N-terminal domain-containing protein [Clostridiales bacterium]